MNSQKTLLQWYQKNKRRFPWRKNRTPYRVWISEIMLQQTRANVVERYFIEWMKAFPNILSLAQAPFEKVLKKWEGLGYYSRVRNIHKAAKMIVEKYQGIFPDQAEKIIKLPGIGPYTLGAILSLAYKKKSLALDGNTQRVLTRFFAIQERKTIHKEGSQFVTRADSWKITEALIELGALVCLPNPKCSICPLKLSCRAYHNQAIDALPTKSRKIHYRKLNRVVCIFHFKDQFLLKSVEKNQIMADLTEFPYRELKSEILSIQEILKEEFSLEHVHQITELEPVEHFFTQYRVKLFPYYIRVKKQMDYESYHWISFTHLKNLTFSSGHRKILKILYEYFTSRSFPWLGRTGNSHFA